ncbi:MAG TPA: PHP domain-containing protein [Holophaga sp.]|nr:PHP domain-containing protein [Holophaga sp.]
MSALDLHMHSLFSDDGEFEPEQLVERAHGLGVRWMALTDHNSVRGVQRAVRHGAEWGVEVIPGIEIDCLFEGVDLHLLAYFIDPSLPDFEALEADITKKEHVAFHRRAEALRGLGLEVDEAPLLAAAHGRIIGTDQLISQVLEHPGAHEIPLLRPYLPGGERSSMAIVNFYWDFLGQGKPAHVAMEYMGLEQALALVRRSGGVPVLAHPGISLASRIELLDPIARAGVVGLEVFSTYHDEVQRADFAGEAERLGLLSTCGSDFHGRIKPGIEIGGHGGALDEADLVERLRRYAG